ncbi:MAG: hypothetical protein H8E31_07915, partial [Planctomycetes bacterium]|nr:hypothetical protein [Planctomycetota bacterium]
RGESARLVLDAVLHLPEPSRQLLLLRYFEDRPPREIARLTGRSSDAIRSHLKRARVQLRSTLAAEYGDGWSSLCLPLAGPPWWLSGPFLVSTMIKPIKIGVAAILLAASLYFVAEFAGRGPLTPENGSLIAGASADPPPTRPANQTAAVESAPALETGRAERSRPKLLLQLVDRLGQPVPGTRVQVFAALPWEDPGRLRGIARSQYAHPLAEFVSDVEGRFQGKRPLSELGLTVLAEKEGYALAGAVYRSVPPAEEGWDLGVLELAQGRVLRLQAEDVLGNPVVGARVAVAGSEGSQGWWNQYGVTDAQGIAEFPFTPPRADWIEVTAASFLRQFHQFEASQDGLDPVIVTMVLDHGEGFRVTVVDGSGAPVADAEVFAREIELPASMRTDRVYGSGLDERSYRGRTASDGSLRVAGLKQQSRGRGCWVAARRDGAVVAIHPVALDDDIRLVLPRSVELRGVVVDPAGVPAAGAELSFVESDRPLWPPAFAGKTDSAGRFACRVTAGQYAILALHERGWLKVVDPMVLDRDRLGLELKLGPGCGLDLEVVTADGQPATRARLSHDYPGVSDYDATPEIMGLAWTGVAYRFLAGRRPDRTGHLRVGCLPPGPCQLMLGGPAFEWDRFELEVPESGLLQVRRELQVRSTGLPSVLVKVRDARGEPVARADLRFRSPQEELYGDGILPETTNRGEYTFQPKELGIWEVNAEKDGRRSPVAIFEVSEAPADAVPQQILLELPPLAGLTVRVLRGTEPVPACEVGAGREPRDYSGRRAPLMIKVRAVTDDSGYAVFAGLPVGPRGLRIEAPSTFPLEFTAELAPGPNTLGVQLGGATVSGVVSGAGADGEIYLGRIVTTRKPASLVAAMIRRAQEKDSVDLCHQMFGQIGTVAHCEEDGSFQFEGVPDGEYLLLATAPGFRITPPRWITVGGEEVDNIRVFLELAGSALVHLQGVKEARQGGRVDILTLEAKLDEETHWPNIDELLDGDVHLPKIDPGVWRFRLNAKDLQGVWTVLDEVSVGVVGGGQAEITLRASS